MNTHNLMAKENALNTGYEYEFVSVVSDEYICRICECPMRKPVQTKCGHRFCKGCLDEANRRKKVRECPMDRQPINSKKNKVFQDKAAERIILSLIIKCPNKGCSWQGELGNLEDHKRKCNYVLLRCPIKYCDITKPKIEMTYHIQKECEWREITCKYCEEKMLSREIKEHNTDCPEFPVACPNECGKEIKRREVEDHIVIYCAMSIVPCSYYGLGCEFQTQREKLNEHIENSLGNHLEILFKHIMKLQEKLNEHEDSLPQHYKHIEKVSNSVESLKNDTKIEQESLASEIQTFWDENNEINTRLKMLELNMDVIRNSEIKVLREKQEELTNKVGFFTTLYEDLRTFVEACNLGSSDDMKAMKHSLTQLSVKLNRDFETLRVKHEDLLWKVDALTDRFEAARRRETAERDELTKKVLENAQNIWYLKTFLTLMVISIAIIMFTSYQNAGSAKVSRSSFF